MCIYESYESYESTFDHLNLLLSQYHFSSHSLYVHMVNGLITNIIKKVQKMKFKTHQPSLPTVEELLDNRDQAPPPEQRSSLVNDPNNPFRTFLENIRELVNYSLDQDGQQYMVVLGVDEQTGYLSMGITRQFQRQEEGDPKKYRENIIKAIHACEGQQMKILQKHSQAMSKIHRAKMFYEQWKKRTAEQSPMKMMISNWMNLLDNPRAGKERSQSRDTAETLEYNQPLANNENQDVELDIQIELISQQSELDLQFMMEVE